MTLHSLFRKYYTPLMWIVIIGTIVSFVAYLTPNSRSGGGGGSVASGSVGSIDGESVSQAQYEAAMREAKVAVFFRQGRWPTSQEISQALPNIAFQQLYVAAKLKELNLEVPVDATAAFTRKVFRLPPGQAFPKEEFEKFVRTELNDKGKVSEDDFYHWVRDQVGVEILIKLYGMNGDLITSKEVESFFRRNHESMTIEMVRFPLTNYTAQITPTPEQIQDFYTKEQPNYRLPEREQLNYIEFNLTNAAYLAVADKLLATNTTLDSQIEQTYLAQKPEAYKDEAGNQLTPEAAKAKIRENTRLQLAARVAQTNAMQLTQLFFDGRKKDPSGTNQLITRDELEKFASTNGLTAVTTPPFDQKHPPRELQFSENYLDMIFQLSATDPEDQYKLVLATNAFFLLGLERKLPSENQTLDVVRAKVVEDYRNSKAKDLAGKAGIAFEDAVRAGLAKGLTFDDVCVEQKIKPQTLTPFSIDTKSIPEIEDPAEFEYITRIAYELPVGDISPFEQIPQIPAEGFLIYLKARTPVDESIVQRDMPAFLAGQREQRHMAAFTIWINQEMRAHVVRPKTAAEEAQPTSG